MKAPIVITGGSSGIGEAIRHRIEAAGYETLNLDIQRPEEGCQNFIACDLSDRGSMQAALAHLPAQVGGLICVAGVGPMPDNPMKVMAVNFLGTRWLTEQILPHIADKGSITLVASSAGRDWRDNRAQVDAMIAAEGFDGGHDWLKSPDSGPWQADAYKFSKQCLAAYTYHAVGKARPSGVRVNCINPGITETNLSTGFRDMLGSETYDRIIGLSGRSGQPTDVAGLAEFLAVGDAEWINGVEITVDGGYFAGVVADWHPKTSGS